MTDDERQELLRKAFDGEIGIVFGPTVIIGGPVDVNPYCVLMPEADNAVVVTKEPDR